jgi:hypothetical protein
MPLVVGSGAKTNREASLRRRLAIPQGAGGVRRTARTLVLRVTPGLVLIALACRAGQQIPLPPAPEVVPIRVPLLLRSVPLRALPLPETPIVICSGGDVMLGSNLDTTWARGAQRRLRLPTLLPDPDSLLAPLRPLVADADVVLLNVEGAIGRGPAPRKCRRGSTSCYAFRQDTAVAGALRRIAPNAEVAGNVANNHAMDAGSEGFARTGRYLADAGVYVVGTDSLPTLVPLPDGDTLALLGFSPFEAGPDPRDLPLLERVVARAATAHHRVVVALHIGAEGVGAQRTPDSVERYLGEDRGNPIAMAHAALAAGASMVVGSGPHVLRGIEWQADGLAIYSLGNLITYGPFSMKEPLDRGAILCASLDRDGRVVQADLRPTHQLQAGFVVPDDTYRAARLVDSLSALDFPETGVRVAWGMIRPRSR